MGIAQRSQIIASRLNRWLAVTYVMASSSFFASAADKPAEPTPEPTPEPTEIPRPDDLNIKKSSPSDELLARDWLKLTLLKTEDVPELAKVPDYADRGLRSRIDESFGFPAIMTMKDPQKNPPQWWTPEVQGVASLSLGPTRHFARPDLQLEIPILRLREIPYLQGESDYVRTMNEVIRLWTLGRLDQAKKLRDQLQKDKKKVPRGTLERTAVAIVNGFFDLQLAVNASEPLLFYGPSLGSLWDALGSTEAKVYLDPKARNKIDNSLFDSALAEPALFSDRGVYPPKLAPPKLKARSMDLSLFIRSLALPSIFNVASLSVKAKNWTRVYEVSSKFDEIYPRLETSATGRENRNLLFTTPSGVATTHPLLLRPQSAHHLQVLINILRVSAQFKAEDPLIALKETAKVILNSKVPAFKTIGFSLAGDIFDDLGYPRYARRFYAFAEAFADVDWYQQNPYFLLGGAENAYWSGDYGIAQQAYEKFLLSAGDKLFGPWARLRLAEITHLQKGTEKATNLYEELLRTQPKHPAGIIARRRLFCIHAPTTGARARHLEYMELKETFPQLELGEVEQIRACHIQSLVNDAAKMSSKSIKSLPEEASLQLELIEEFKQKFPLSGYLKFFESRVTALQAAMGPYHLAFKECGPALEFVRKNQDKIAALKKQSGKFLDNLKWTEDEQQRLLRCAALFTSAETLEKVDNSKMGRKGASKKSAKNKKAKANEYESSEQRLVRMTIAMTLRPSDKQATELLSELRRRGQKSLLEDVRQIEQQQSQTIDDPNFWNKLATLKVMQWDLEQPAKNKPKLNKMMRAEALRRPDQTLLNKEFCERFMLESSSMTRAEWDAFVLAIPKDRWLELTQVSEPVEKQESKDKSSCSNQVAIEALRTAQSLPSLSRDRHLLWPWLQARGAQKEQEAWLALGQRWAQQGSVSKQELENLFKTLVKEADNPVVRQAAKAWIESRKPSGLW